jgi:acetyl-CoA synthetase
MLQDERVNVWYTAPTAIRMLMRVGDELPRKFDLSALRFVASVGEPLHAEGVLWGRDALGLPIHDISAPGGARGIRRDSRAALGAR